MLEHKILWNVDHKCES